MIGDASNNLRIGVAPGGAGSGDTYIRTNSSQPTGGSLYIGPKNYGGLLNLLHTGRLHVGGAFSMANNGVNLKKYFCSGSLSPSVTPNIVFTFGNGWFSAKLWCLSVNDENSNNTSVLTTTLLGGNLYNLSPSSNINTVDTNIVTNGVAPWSSSITSTPTTITLTGATRSGYYNYQIYVEVLTDTLISISINGTTTTYNY